MKVNWTVMRKIERKKYRILYIETKEIKLQDIPRALDEVGFDVYRATFNFSAQGYSIEAMQLVKDSIEQFDIQYTISYDFSESIAQACYEAGTPYISWVYDAPQKELYTHYALYPSNYIFVFDKMQQKRLQEIGIENVFHMPLAILENKVRLNLERTERKETQTEISFVGQLYKRESVIDRFNHADGEIQKSIEKNIEACFLQWSDKTYLYGRMQDRCVQYFTNADQYIVLKNYPYMTEQFYYETAATSRLLANRERVTILNKLAEKYEVKFYTKDEDTSQLSKKVKILPSVIYDEISQIYYNSKININITLHCIESGAPQRIFDVMAAGGFMLSNYQKELEELFVVGEEIVLYHDLKELEELVEYYLIHEEERKRIARRGQKKVLKYHDLHNRMIQIMEIVLKKEQGRKQHYLLQQREWIWLQADKLLEDRTKKNYRELARLLGDLKHQTVLQKTTELRMLQQMVECWNLEIKTDRSNVFCNVASVKEAEQKYLSVKHTFWRMEAGICGERCQEDILNMCKREESKLLIAWIIKANVQQWENVIIQTSQYIREYDMSDAVEFLSYADLLVPGNKRFLLQKAEGFMELGMWMKALASLREIEEKDRNIEEMIKELSGILEETEDE